jgi:16S rRNA (cytidine1402-2'-O)-methyltransferase
MKGKLYLIPTTLGDFKTIFKTIPQYNLEVIHSLSIFIVENVRTARRFLSKTKHPVPIDEMTFFEMGKHTPQEKMISYFEALTKGNDVGLLSEAGTPCVADPGAIIAGMAHKKEIDVIPLVGPSSIILALMASGFNGQNFAFHGYLPVNKNELVNKLKELEHQIMKSNQTQIFIETPFRNNQLLEMIKKNCKPGTRLCIAYNLTLPDERIISSSIQEWKKKLLDLNKKPAVFLLYS